MAHQYANGLADDFLLSPRRRRTWKHGGKVRGGKRRILTPATSSPQAPATTVYVKDIAAEFALKIPHRRALREAGFDFSGYPMVIPVAQAAALRLELSHRMRRSDEYAEDYLIGILRNRVQFRMNEFDARSGPLISTAEIIGCVPPGALRIATSLGKVHRFIHKSAVEDTVMALQALVDAKLKAVAVADTAVARQENAQFMLEADAAKVAEVEEAPPAVASAEPVAAGVRWTRNFKSNGSSVNVNGTREWFDRLAQFVEVELRAKNGGKPVSLGIVIHDALESMMNGSTQVETPEPSPDRLAILGQIVEEAVERKVGADLAKIGRRLGSINSSLAAMHRPVPVEAKLPWIVVRIGKYFSLRF